MFNTKGKIALRAVKELAKRLGYTMYDYPNLELTQFDKTEYTLNEKNMVNKLNTLIEELNKTNETLRMLLDYLKLEIFEGKEIRKIK